MPKNVKLGNDVLEGVERVQLENADSLGEYVDFYENGQKEEQTKSVSLNMSEGNQVVEPDDDKVLTQVTIEKPDTLVAENIKKDVNVGGVVGSLETGSPITGGYTVTFIDYDGSKYNVTTVKAGGQITAPIAPTRSGYSFVGWVTTQGDSSTQVIFPYTVSADVVLYAEYTESIELHAGDVLTFKDTLTIDNDETINIKFRSQLSNTTYYSFNAIELSYFPGEGYYYMKYQSGGYNIYSTGVGWFYTRSKTIEILEDISITSPASTQFLLNNIQSGLPPRG